jgi:hypothetical protein
MIARRRCPFSADDFVSFGVLARRRDLWTGLPKVQCPQHSDMGMHDPLGDKRGLRALKIKQVGLRRGLTHAALSLAWAAR